MRRKVELSRLGMHITDPPRVLYIDEDGIARLTLALHNPMELPVPVSITLEDASGVEMPAQTLDVPPSETVEADAAMKIREVPSDPVRLCIAHPHCIRSLMIELARPKVQP